MLGVVGANGAGQVDAPADDRGHPAAHVRAAWRSTAASARCWRSGVGFNRELTGRENVVLGGLAAGLTREQVAEKYEDIAEFAELEDFMDMPMQTYSSGMYGRLAFSVAVNMDPDILLIDEALSAGDARFQREVLREDARALPEDRTIVLVSHALGSIAELCDQAIWINKGHLDARRPGRGHRRLQGVPSRGRE